jgi:two-component sensor histidine kinase
MNDEVVSISVSHSKLYLIYRQERAGPNNRSLSMTVSTEDTLTRVREYQRVLEGLSRVGAEVMPPDRLMHHVSAQVSRVTHIERTKVMKHRPDKGDLFVAAGVGWKPGVVGNATLAIDHRSPAGRAFQTAAPVTIDNLNDTQEFRLPEILREHGIVSLVNVPVMINGFTWGVLEVDSSELKCFDEWDVGFLSTVANIMGTCLALHEAQQRHIDERAQRERDRAQSDIVMQELQHRIKNNLQIIVSFLSLKIRESSIEVREGMNAVIGRVQAVALAHDLLSLSKQTGSVEFAGYLRSLCANVDPQRPGITIEVDADPAQIPIDRAVPAGLVVNELITNSIKYAFGNSAGKIRIKFALVGNSSEGCVSVEDDGSGMDIPPKKGLGLTLVEGLAQQIQGRIQFVAVESGSRTILCFPVAPIWS